MSYIRPTNTGLVRPTGIGTSSGADIAWSTLSTTAMVDSLTDPNGISTGAWSMSGNRIQIPVSDSAQHQSISAGLRGYWELPGGVMPGADGLPTHCLVVSVDVANPSAAWAVHLGIVEEAASRGVGSGVRYKTGGPGWGGQAVQWGSFDSAVTVGSTLQSHVGHVSVSGALGSTNVATLATSAAVDSANKGAPASVSGFGTWASGGTPRLCAIVTYHGVSLSTLTLDCLIRYALVPLPS